MGMKLIEHLRNLPADQRDAFAQACETSVGHLRNVAYGYRPCAPELAVRIERISTRQVTRQDLRPDDWHLIWPELEDFKPNRPEETVYQAQAAINSDVQGVAHA